MAKYVVETSHIPEECLKDLDEMSAKAPEMLSKFVWGCAQGEHKGWAYVDAESKEDILETIDFIKRNRLVNVSLYPLTPLPGTPIWDYAKEKKLVHDNMNWDLLSFSNFQYNYSASVHLSKKLTRKELFDIIQLFRRQRRISILKLLVNNCLLNPQKIPDVINILIQKTIVKIKIK